MRDAFTREVYAYIPHTLADGVESGQPAGDGSFIETPIVWDEDAVGEPYVLPEPPRSIVDINQPDGDYEQIDKPAGWTLTPVGDKSLYDGIIENTAEAALCELAQIEAGIAEHRRIEKVIDLVPTMSRLLIKVAFFRYNLKGWN